MKKRVKGRKFGRDKNQRRALKRTLANSLFMKGRIKTTEAKAKEMSPVIQKYITRAKKGTLASKRLLLEDLTPKVVKKLETEIAPKYKDRKGGYTRIVKMGPRKSDGAKMAIIELV